MKKQNIRKGISNTLQQGNKYGRLAAIRLVKMRNNGQALWLFKCDCGKKKEILAGNVKNGTTKSCGCWQKEEVKKRMTTHGMTKTPEFESWWGMIKRCLKKNSVDYHRYGRRGIKICNRWLGKKGFENFYKDMGERSEGMTLDRINNDSNYKPKNCRWATREEQSNNTRKNIFVSVNGVQIPFKELAEMFRIKYRVLYQRIFKYNWDLKRALTAKS